MEGWNTEQLSNLMMALEKCRSLHYELSNCIRGCYSGAHTYPELKAHVQEIIRMLELGAEDCDYIREEEYEED